MLPVNRDELIQYVREHIIDFHQKRLQKIREQKLTTVLRKKNPYLFRAKNILSPEALVRSVMDAYVSSGEETMFGDFLETIAIFINHKVYGGRKSATRGIDLEFENENTRYIVAIKSGPNWGNSSQIRRMVGDFEQARRVLRTSGNKERICAVNGCCYGKTTTGREYKPKGDYYKYSGQAFWEFISGDADLFIEIIEPIAYSAKERNEEFDQEYARLINRLSREFMDSFCTDDSINWEALLRFNSARSPS